MGDYDNYNINRYRLLGINASYELLGEDAGAVICTIGNRVFQKTNPGWALAAYFYSINGYTGPLLVSHTAANVTYTPVGFGDIVYSATVTYNGRIYYVSDKLYSMGGNINDSSGTGRVKMTQTDHPGVAYELLDRYFRVGIYG